VSSLWTLQHRVLSPARDGKNVILLEVLFLAVAGQLLSDWIPYRTVLMEAAKLQVERNGIALEKAIPIARLLRFRDTEEFQRGKRKKAWLAFILVFFVGPFGFLYYSWRTSIMLFGRPWSLANSFTVYSLHKVVPA
jgi:hypothetical protein